ncbi:MAG: SGNH/GDSL hydrolase family protein [Actinobacteria bacterium]|nr:SGNH/GDSL hydrolase family protein [Actinomycetota bacterium]
MGDSFTEGLWDSPDGPDAPQRGWADRLAEHLSARRVAAGQSPLQYANLAVRGKLLRPIVRDQLPQALDLGADLVSLVGGGNDLLRIGANPDLLARHLELGVVRAREAGADVLLSTGTDTGTVPLMRSNRARVAVYNTHIWSIARRHGAHVLDLWGMRSLMDWRMWADDRIHLTPEGHERVAQAALVGLGLVPDAADWDDPLIPLPPARPVERWRQDAQWAREHVVPWVDRHVHGRSSGDGRSGKRPELSPIA